MMLKMEAVNNKYDNSNYDCSTQEYKIYKITNMVTGLYFISYTRLKYLSKVKEDLLRKPSKNFKLLFKDLDDKNDILIELINIIKTDNIYYVKQAIKSIEKDDNAIIKKCDLPLEKCDDCNDDEDKKTDIKTDKKEEKSLNKIKEQNRENKAQEPKKTYKYPNKLCDKCGYEFTYKNYSRHYKSCNK